MKARLLVALAFLLALAVPAIAHTLSETHSAWHITGRTIDMNFTLPDIEAQRLAPSGQNFTDAMITSYLGKHLSVTADGKNCTVNYGPEKGTAAQGFTRWEFSFTCPTTAKDVQLVDTADRAAVDDVTSRGNTNAESGEIVIAGRIEIRQDGRFSAQ